MQTSGHRSVFLAFAVLCTERAKAINGLAEKKGQLQQIVGRKLSRENILFPS